MPKRLHALAAWAAICLAAAAPPALAQPPETEPPIQWKKPITYSMGMMGIGIVGLVLTGQADHDPSFSRFSDAFGAAPRSDDDSPLYNFVLHPLWGSETYLRAREAHMGVLGSVGFSFGASLTWEYLIESWTEHPSTQDLVFTTGIGWLLGELRYRLKQRSTGETHWWIDPIHTGLEHWGVGVAQSEAGRKRPRLRFSVRF